jgi:hypothetical protein
MDISRHIGRFMRKSYEIKGTRDKAQGTRHKAQGTRDKVQGTRHKKERSDLSMLS